MMDFAERYGPWALVTGASDGIGRELARGLARRGLDLVVVARRGDRLEALARELAPARVIPLTADLSRPEGVAKVIGAAADLEVGLVSAIAGYGAAGSFLQTRREDELGMVDVNCRAVLALAHAFAPRLAERGRGGFILMSSIVGFQGVPGQANYAATKAYVQTLAEGLAAELGPRGVDVLASAPGPVHTGFAERAGMRIRDADSAAGVAEGTLRALGRRSLVRPGPLSRTLGYALAGLPRRGRTLILGRVMAGMISKGVDGANSAQRPA